MTNTERPATRPTEATESWSRHGGQVNGAWERRSVARLLNRDCNCLSRGGGCWTRVVAGRCAECREGIHTHSHELPYAERVAALESEDMTTSDAQGVADAERGVRWAELGSRLGVRGDRS